MKQKATAVMIILVGLCGLCLLAAIGLEIWDGIISTARIDKLGVASGLKPLLKYNALQQWVVLSLGLFLVFLGLTVLTWQNYKRL